MLPGDTLYIYIYISDSIRLVDLFLKKTIRLIIDEFKKKRERKEDWIYWNRLEINWITTNLHTYVYIFDI